MGVKTWQRAVCGSVAEQVGRGWRRGAWSAVCGERLLQLLAWQGGERGCPLKRPAHRAVALPITHTLGLTAGTGMRAACAAFSGSGACDDAASRPKAQRLAHRQGTIGWRLHYPSDLLHSQRTPSAPTSRRSPRSLALIARSQPPNQPAADGLHHRECCSLQAARADLRRAGEQPDGGRARRAARRVAAPLLRAAVISQPGGPPAAPCAGGHLAGGKAVNRHSAAPSAPAAALCAVRRALHAATPGAAAGRQRRCSSLQRIIIAAAMPPRDRADEYYAEETFGGHVSSGRVVSQVCCCLLPSAFIVL